MGNSTPGVMKLCAWLKNSFENFYELEYNVLVKLQECWWKINAHEVAPFTRSESYGQRPYANFKTKKAPARPGILTNATHGNCSYHIENKLCGITNIFMTESTKRHKENSNIIKEIRASTYAAIRNQGASIKTLEIKLVKMSNVLQERGIGSCPGLS
ncbi:hypothetical protein Tco_0588479 [Tanacetum coccineum]